MIFKVLGNNNIGKHYALWIHMNKQSTNNTN